MELWMALVSIILGCIGIFLYRTMTIFKFAGIPHEAPYPILGNMLPVAARKENFVFHVVNCYRKFPDVKYFGVYDFITPVIVIRDIELIKDIAVKNFDNFTDHRSFVSEESDPVFGKSLFGLKGDKWRDTRSLLSPAFTTSKMRQMSDLMSSVAKDFADFLVEHAKNGETDFEMKDAFTKYTNDAIASCAFGITVNTMKNPNNDFYLFGRDITNFQGMKTVKILITRFWPALSRWLRIRVFDEKVTDFFMDIVKTTIETREREGISRPDMIQLMMESRGKSNVIQLDLLDMTAQAFLFFFGGFDTSSSLMTFAALALAQHPEYQDRLIEEVDEVMRQSNGSPSYDQVYSMPYLEAFLHESLRYFPILGVNDRLCTKSFELPPAKPGLKPYVVPAGMNIWFPAHGIHEDPQYYENPTTFDPERFMNQKIALNTPTFLAFGMGPRSCIGNRFALLETKMVLFHLLSKCKFAVSPKLKQPVSFRKDSVTMLIDGGCWLTIVPR